MQVQEPKPLVLREYPQNANPLYKQAVVYLITKETYNWSTGGSLGCPSDEKIRQLRGDYEHWFAPNCDLCFDHIDLLAENAVFWRHPSERGQHYAHVDHFAQIAALTRGAKA